MTQEDKAIQLLQRCEPRDGYEVMFSGGKDSIVIAELARMAGVKYTKHYSVTSVDPPELIGFIRDHHPDTVFHKPEKTMFQLIREIGAMPHATRRYCCQYLKEQHNPAVGKAAVFGVRWAESSARAARWHDVDWHDKRRFLIVNPIVRWSDKAVWAFIRRHKLPYCELYDEGFSRLGCVLCPMSDMRKSAARWPRIAAAYLRAIEDAIDAGGFKKPIAEGCTAEDVFNGYINGQSYRQVLGDKQQCVLDIGDDE